MIFQRNNPTLTSFSLERRDNHIRSIIAHIPQIASLAKRYGSIMLSADVYIGLFYLSRLHPVSYLWMLFSYRSVLLPGRQLGPMILHFIPVPMVPEKTRPKAQNLPLSDVGTILLTYIISGPLLLHAFMEMATSSSVGPSYSSSIEHRIRDWKNQLLIPRTNISPGLVQFKKALFTFSYNSLSYNSDILNWKSKQCLLVLCNTN